MSLIRIWSGKPQDLEALRWNNRVLLLFASSSTATQLTKQLADIRLHETAFEDRDVVVFTVGEKTSAGHALRERLKVAVDGFTLILIGKDGTEKLRKHTALPAEEILQLIDSMPMRRAGGR